MHWFRSYGDSNCWITNGWILPSGPPISNFPHQPIHAKVVGRFLKTLKLFKTSLLRFPKKGKKGSVQSLTNFTKNNQFSWGSFSYFNYIAKVLQTGYNYIDIDILSEWYAPNIYLCTFSTIFIVCFGNCSIYLLYSFNFFLPNQRQWKAPWREVKNYGNEETRRTWVVPDMLD